ncbi:MAG: MtrB/PioB family outer membrane beta-barrel protein [Nitrospirota bacterium]|jgi:hypothetical protein
MRAIGKFLVLLTVFLAFAVPSPAQEGTDTDMTELEAILSGEAEVAVYRFPEIPPEFSLKAGYRFVEHSDSPSAIDYVYLKDSVVLGGSARFFEFPHRAYLVFDWTNEKDYFGDLRYAYGDLFLARWVTRSVFHNTENVILRDLDPSTGSPGVIRRDAGEEYGVRTGVDDVTVRLKAPGYPAHALFRYWSVGKKGDEQLRDLLGSGFLFVDVKRASQRRDVDWQTQIYSAGANSHLGPVEVQYVHDEKRFGPDGDKVLFDSYSATPIRPAGTFPHSLVPEFKGSSDTVEFHSSYTGKIVASGTVSHKERENETSGATADYMAGSAQVTFMPWTRLAFYMRYRYARKDTDIPRTVSIVDLSDSTNTFTGHAKPPVDATTNTLTLTARCRATKQATMRVRYTFENVDRKNASFWELPDRTQKNSLRASLDVRPARSLDLALHYDILGIDDPAYGSDPSFAQQAGASATWTPRGGSSVFLTYTLRDENRDSLRVAGAPQAGQRDVLKHLATVGTTVQVLRNLAVSLGYTFMYNDYKQDVVFDDLMGAAQVAPDTKYEEEAHVATASLAYSPLQWLGLSADASYTRSDGDIRAGSVDLREPLPLSALVDFGLSETYLAGAAEFRLPRGFALRASFEYIDVQKLDDNPNNDVFDGDAQIAMFTVSRQWK